MSSFARPTLGQLRDRAKAELATRLGLGAVVSNGALAAMGEMEAALEHGVYGALDHLSDQFLPNANNDSDNLERLASLAPGGALVRKSAQGASGTVTFTGADTSDVPAGTVVVRADGATFTTQADAVISGGSVSTLVVADVPDGISGVVTDTPAATSMQVQSPISGVSSTVTVDSNGGYGLSNGFDLETDALLLQRVLAAYQTPPFGGAQADYVEWALQNAGVTRAWVVSPYPYAGYVGVGFVYDGQTPSIFPSGGQVTAMTAYLTDPTRKPVTANVVAFAPTELDVAVTLTLTPNNAVVQAAVVAALQDLFTRSGNLGTKLKINLVRQAISNAPGVTDFVLTVPSSDVSVSAGQLPVLGTVTFS